MILVQGTPFLELIQCKFQFSGGSAAQSSIFQVFDAVLGITHPKVEGV